MESWAAWVQQGIVYIICTERSPIRVTEVWKQFWKESAETVKTIVSSLAIQLGGKRWFKWMCIFWKYWFLKNICSNCWCVLCYKLIIWMFLWDSLPFSAYMKILKMFAFVRTCPTVVDLVCTYIYNYIYIHICIYIYIYHIIVKKLASFLWNYDYTMNK